MQLIGYLCFFFPTGWHRSEGEPGGRSIALAISLDVSPIRRGLRRLSVQQVRISHSLAESASTTDTSPIPIPIPIPFSNR